MCDNKLVFILDNSTISFVVISRGVHQMGVLPYSETLTPLLQGCSHMTYRGMSGAVSDCDGEGSCLSPLLRCC